MFLRYVGTAFELLYASGVPTSGEQINPLIYYAECDANELPGNHILNGFSYRLGWQKKKYQANRLKKHDYLYEGKFQHLGKIVTFRVCRSGDRLSAARERPADSGG